MKLLLHTELHWLDVLEHVMYKLCMMMWQWQNCTLRAHCVPILETASQQRLVQPPVISWLFHYVIWSGMVNGHLLSLVRWHRTCCPNVCVNHPIASLPLVVFWKHFFFQSPAIFSTLEALATMCFINSRLHYITSCNQHTENGDICHMWIKPISNFLDFSLRVLWNNLVLPHAVE